MALWSVGGRGGRGGGPVLAPIAPPPGAISPPNCKVVDGSAAIARGTAGLPISLTLNAFDANDRRIYEGGARVKLKARLQAGEGGGTVETFEGVVRDNGCVIVLLPTIISISTAAQIAKSLSPERFIHHNSLTPRAPSHSSRPIDPFP